MSVVRNIIRWIKVDRTGKQLQIEHFGGGIVSRVDHIEPQGLHFSPPVAAQGIGVSPGGVSSDLVAICTSGQVPSKTLQPGEGGLHLLGTFKVFLKADGTVLLGSDAAADAIALASKTDARISALQAKLDALITKYNEHTHTTTATVGSGPAVGVISSTTATETAVGSQASVASQKVKAE